MAPPRKHREKEKKLLAFPQPLPREPSAYAAAVSEIAVAQICLAVGYSAAQTSALRAFADIAARHLQAITRSAASAAEACGRTDSNIVDVVQALEDLSSLRGFAGATKLKRPPLQSIVLRELMDFVDWVDEIPFAKRLRHGTKQKESRTWKSFAEAGQEPPFRHVPRWLPVFPEAEQLLIEERGEYHAEEKEGVMPTSYGGGGDERRTTLPAEREVVRFQMVSSGNSKNKKRKVQL